MFSDKETFKKAFVEKLEIMHGISLKEANILEKYEALGSLIREYTTKNWIATKNLYRDEQMKQIYYFSMEFLLGRLMDMNLINLGLKSDIQEGLAELGIDFGEIEDQEPDAGLGNGGLGRLGACFLDSLASLNLPGHGCGIRYKYGLFEQKIIDGFQVELPEYWLREINVWEVRRPDSAVEVRFGGLVNVGNANGRMTFDHVDYESVLAVPYDMPVIGYRNNTVNTLRLWSAETVCSESEFVTLSSGGACKFRDYRDSTESISEFLYPDDTNREGQLLRLKQEYFFVSAGLQSIVEGYKKRYGSINELHTKVAIHLNDTHPVLAIPELMRILLDLEKLEWEEAWYITTETMSYTNHTIMSEALEKWSVELMKSLLPRIYLIIEEINERFCRELWTSYPGEWDLISKMAIIADGQVKMAHLAVVGSHSINGVSKMHTNILMNQVMSNFYNFYPQKFNNKTNGITHRRWLIKANPALSKVITETIGTKWIDRPAELKELLNYSNDASFIEAVQKTKEHNKNNLARLIKESTGLIIDTDSIFDVQVKRLHLYKRQLLNILHIMDMYNRLLENPDIDIYPRTFIFGAKAAPGYHLSKKVIKLINTIASLVNNDARIKNKIKVVFLENYRVSLAEKIIPAADLSEQISTATKEASGTGNMKFMMNGAITLGTLDGANVEILEEVGSDNIFIFGLSPIEVLNFNRHGGYNPWDIYNSDPRIKTILEQLMNGFLPGLRNEFEMIYHFLLYNNDEFFILKDFASYAEAQNRVDQTFRNRNKWIEMGINNIAHSGRFASDRAITEYATEIWGIKPANLV